MEVDVLSPLGVSIMIGIIISILKNFVPINTKWWPIVSICIGLLYYTLCILKGHCGVMYAIQGGIVSGGAASGLYRGAKVLGGSNNKTVDAVINPLTVGRDNNNPINTLFKKE